MIIKHAENQRDNIIAILSAQELPVNDLSETLGDFLLASENGKVTGVIGLEIYGNYGLLRSLAVVPEYRNMGIATKLIEHLEHLAVIKGLNEIYLFTETATEYFTHKAYQKITRGEVPEEVKLSSEFSHVCPSSAIVMKKKLN